MLIYGPIPSRRLGRSLGINHIPPKTCTYSCLYCQVGRTNTMIIGRKHFYDPEYILSETESQVNLLKEKGERIDYLSFVPDGEPTLDINLGEMARLLKKLEIPTATISNGSLMWMEEVRHEMQSMDW